MSIGWGIYFIAMFIAIMGMGLLAKYLVKSGETITLQNCLWAAFFALVPVLNFFTALALIIWFVADGSKYIVVFGGKKKS